MRHRICFYRIGRFLWNRPLLNVCKSAMSSIAHYILPSSDSLIKCLTIFNMPFTFFKGMLDVVLCFLIYKPLSPLLHK